jgi:hypothetical protein
MTKFSKRFPTSIRKRYIKWFPPTEPIYDIDRDVMPDRVAQKIYETLMTEKPCMIARFGSVEIGCVCNYLAIQKPNPLKYIQGIKDPWWWTKETIHHMKNNAGFFSPTEENLERFSKLMIESMPLVDILASWRHEEKIFKKELAQAYKIHLELLTPFWSSNPWTKALEGKKVLVVHPFIETMEKQYLRRELIHQNPDILPQFELKTLKAVQSIGGNCPDNFSNWFEALEYMQQKIDNIDYDICIIGCGAYGFPLAAHVKRKGKKAIHMGGATQLLFGIRGKRWENYFDEFDYKKWMNSFWVRPSAQETPMTANQIESGCYW